MSEKRTPGLAKQTPREFDLYIDPDGYEHDICENSVPWTEGCHWAKPTVHVREVLADNNQIDAWVCSHCDTENHHMDFKCATCPNTTGNECANKIYSLQSDLTQARETVTKQENLITELVVFLSMANFDFLEDRMKAKELLDRARLTLEEDKGE